VLPDRAHNPGDVDPFLAIKRQLIAKGAVDEGRHMAQLIAAQASNLLDRLPSTEIVAELRHLLQLILTRDS
jgi:hypothetical protein